MLVFDGVGVGLVDFIFVVGGGVGGYCYCFGCIVVCVGFVLFFVVWCVGVGICGLGLVLVLGMLWLRCCVVLIMFGGCLVLV